MKKGVGDGHGFSRVFFTCNYFRTMKKVVFLMSGFYSTFEVRPPPKKKKMEGGGYKSILATMVNVFLQQKLVALTKFEI